MECSDGLHHGDGATPANTTANPVVRAAAAPVVARRRRHVDVTIPILLAATVVHVIRQNVLDTTVFLATIALILIDHRRPVPPLDPETRHRAVAATRSRILIVAALFGMVIGLFHPDTWPVGVGLAAAGLLAVVVVLRTPAPAVTDDAPEDGSSLGRGWIVWAAFAVAVCLWELASFVQQPDPQTDSYTHPTLSSLIQPMLGSPLVRALVFALWLAGGIWLVRMVLNRAEHD
ncbi:MAG TPA: hypothetical protein VGM78_12220 [Ilumatobacteraceae bacterium]